MPIQINTAVKGKEYPPYAVTVERGKIKEFARAIGEYGSVVLIGGNIPIWVNEGMAEYFGEGLFTGDGFVKNNIITRLLQSEVDHVQKDDASLTALTPANYKFSCKGTTQLEGRLVHVYQLKPRKKRPNLFKGRIYLDAHTGSLVRAEGTVVKSPSFFIKKIDFVQDYTDVGPFTLPAHIHSEAVTRIVGRAVVDIYHHDYQPTTNAVQAMQQIPAL